MVSNFPKLDPKVFMPIIERWKANKPLLAPLEKAIKADTALLVDGLAGAPVAMCGKYIVTGNEVAEASASVTLRDGTAVGFADVAYIVLANGMRIPAGDILKIYGGRSGYVKVAVSP